MAGFRPRRVADQIRCELAELLMHSVKDPRVGFATVTEVRVSPDLRHARVYVSVMGDEEAMRDSLAALRRAAGYLRREVGRRITLRHVPELRFVADETLAHSARIEAILDDVLPEDSEPEEGEHEADEDADA